MSSISLIFCLCLIYLGFQYLREIDNSFRFFELNYKKNLLKTFSYPKIVILMPLLREQRLIKGMMDYFSRISDKGNIEMIIITTEKEIYEKNQSVKYPFFSTRKCNGLMDELGNTVV